MTGYGCRHFIGAILSRANSSVLSTELPFLRTTCVGELAIECVEIGDASMQNNVLKKN